MKIKSGKVVNYTIASFNGDEDSAMKALDVARGEFYVALNNYKDSLSKYNDGLVVDKDRSVENLLVSAIGVFRIICAIAIINSKWRVVRKEFKRWLN